LRIVVSFRRDLSPGGRGSNGAGNEARVSPPADGARRDRRVHVHVYAERMSTESDRERWRRQKRQQRIRAGTAVGDLSALIDAGNLPPRPTRQQLLDALGVRAREGSVPAMRLLLEEYRRDAQSGEKPTSTIDELARRRR
jgi:hypothetical protein